MVGLRALSPSLLMMPNCVVRRTPQKGEMSYRDTCTGGNNGLGKTVWSLTKMTVKSCTWYRITNEPVWVYIHVGGEVTLKGTWGSWWKTSWTQVSALLQQQRQIRSWRARTGALLAETETQSFHCTQHAWGPTWSISSSSVQETWGDWKESKGWPQKLAKSWDTDPVRKDRRN